ncbi:MULTISPECIES: type II toxin-antitoxin system RelE/ParE family toxin [unclassified Variovorax]|uniref:type II toxin-antitoxin system RelE/ParE family toxin n=1 Tax=unclassified Variovorax TaxID=663243 RepID=UPI001BD6D676|nr:MULTISPECIES: type II toxin-antitoxin system RelE/ParE family toxin [unclassified Variovorax]
MTRIELAPAVFDDLDRFIDHMEQFEVANFAQRIKDLVAAFDILRHSPLIGRPVKNGRRELLVGRDSYAYVARYQYIPNIDMVLVLALRSQRESGFKQKRR